jgi:hypothetical protein
MIQHWLRGLCKKAENCEFLHEFDMSKMPECFFFSKYGECSNAECLYRHINPEDKKSECPWYARGFCKHGECTQRCVCVCKLQGEIDSNDRMMLCENCLCMCAKRKSIKIQKSPHSAHRTAHRTQRTAHTAHSAHSAHSVKRGACIN